MTVNTDDLALYYELWEAQAFDQNRKPLVFLGGLPTDTVEDWHDFASTLSADRDVLLVEMRGLGQTGEGPTPGDYTLAQLNTDVQDLIAAIWQEDPNQQPVIIGCSDRGKVALTVGLSAAQRISGVITCGTSPGGALQQDGPNLATRNALLTDGTWITNSQQYVEIVAGSNWANAPMASAWHARLATKSSSIDGVERYETILSASVGPVQFISDPTLVIHGDADEVYLPGTGPALATAVGGNATSAIIDGPHAFWLTSPTSFLQVIREFVEARVDT